MVLLVMLADKAFGDPRPPAVPAMKPGAKQNPFRGGQPVDLVFRVKNVQWITTPCPAPATEVIVQQLRVTIEIDWVKAVSWHNVFSTQSESPGDFDTPDTADGPDYLTLQWKGNGRYTLASLFRGTTDIFPPSAETQSGGNGTWNGVKINVSEMFEEGQQHPIEYTFTFNYTRQGEECSVQALEYRGHFVHTYDGVFYCSSGISARISAGFPWSYSVGLTASFDWANDRAWTKHLVNPLPMGPAHIDKWTPPDNAVPDASCCPTPEVRESIPSVGALESVPSSMVRGDSVLVQYRAHDAESGVEFVELSALSPDGALVATQTTTFSPPCSLDCLAPLSIVLPETYTDPSLTVVAAAFDDHGNRTVDATEVTVVDPLVNPILKADSGLKHGRLLCPDTLDVEIRDNTPGTTAGDVGSRVTIASIDTAGTVFDTEDALSFTDLGGRFAAALPVSADGIAQTNDGVLTVRSGDVVSAEYADDDAPTTTSSVPVVCEEECIVTTAASQPVGDHTKFLGIAEGGRVKSLIDGVSVAVSTTNGESARSIATRFVSAINTAGIAGVSARLVWTSGARILGAGSVYILDLDPGICLAAELPPSGPRRRHRMNFASIESDRTPHTNVLFQNDPNPFNPWTTIRFDLAHEGHVKLRIFDVAGRVIRVLVDENLGADQHSRLWDGRDNAGRSVATGIYFYRLETADFRDTRKMVVLR